MTTLLETKPKGRLPGEPRARGGHAAAPGGGRRATLDERLGGTWREARATGTASCPLCGGSMSHSGSSADCADCGTRLA